MSGTAYGGTGGRQLLVAGRSFVSTSLPCRQGQRTASKACALSNNSSDLVIIALSCVMPNLGWSVTAKPGWFGRGEAAEEHVLLSQTCSFFQSKTQVTDLMYKSLCTELLLCLSFILSHCVDLCCWLS